MWGIVLALVLAAGAPTSPVNTVEDAARSAVNARPAGACAGERVTAALLQLATGTYVLYITETRFLLLDNADGDETPVWMGQVLPGGQMVVRETMTFGELSRRYPMLCDYFKPSI